MDDCLLMLSFPEGVNEEKIVLSSSALCLDDRMSSSLVCRMMQSVKRVVLPDAEKARAISVVVCS